MVPEITYTGTEEIMPNGLSNVAYKPKDGAIYDVNTVVNVDEGNPFSFAGHFSKPQTTDDVIVKVITSNERYDDNGNVNPNFVEKEVYRAEYGWQDVVDTDISADIANAEKLPNVSFIISSSSNVDWQSIKWAPVVTYNDSTGTSRNINVYPHYLTYAKMDAEGSSKTFLAQDTVINVKPTVTFGSADVNGTVTLLAKTQDKLIAKKSFAIANSVIALDSLTIENVGTDKVWFEYAYPETLSSAVTASTISVRRGNAILPETIAAGFYSYGQDDGFGMLYRGWGGFTYNASDGRYARPIDEALLKLPEDKDAKIDPLTYPFTPIGTDQMSLNRWVGQHTDIYLTADEAGSARLVEQDVVLTNPLDNIGNIAGISGEKLQGTGASTFTQISTNKSTSTMGGAMGVTYSDANGNAKTEVMMMDMNGDGYPDLIAGGSIQYTNSQGGLSGEKLSDIGTIKSKNDSYAWGYGGDPVHSVTNIVQMVKPAQKTDGSTTTTTTPQPEGSAANDAQSNKISIELSKVNPSWSVSGSVPHNSDDTKSCSWMLTVMDYQIRLLEKTVLESI